MPADQEQLSSLRVSESLGAVRNHLGPPSFCFHRFDSSTLTILKWRMSENIIVKISTLQTT